MPLYPTIRMRRLRKYSWLRELVQEVRLHPSDFIYPLFVQEGYNNRTPIVSLPGQARVTLDLLIQEVKEVESLGIPAVALFPVVSQEKKDAWGNEGLNPNNLICRSIKAIREKVPAMGIIADVALDPYTSHGHDGILTEDGQDIDNDETVARLCRQAVIQAAAGCQIIAPSDMMDGRVAAIRQTLDVHGYEDVSILSYAVKYASAFYGPFREAVGSSVAIGKSGKHTYQMSSANTLEALREAVLDREEGADMLMVKPGGPYLDILYRIASIEKLPVLAYQVSGEYAMIKAAEEKGWLDGKQAMLESLLALKRAGARAILTYAAKEAAMWLSTGNKE